MKLFYTLLLLLISLTSTHTHAQLGGNYVFGFLNLPTGARVAGLGGYASPTADKTLDFAITNPSLANESMLGNYSLQQAVLPSGITFGTISTALALKKGILVPYIRHVSYGSFQGYDATGNTTNTFSAFDFQAGASYAYPLNPVFTLGVNAGIIGSYLETYSSYGLAGSFAVQYHDPNELVHATILARNVGVQLKGYTGFDDALNPLPLEIQSSVSIKLKHAPFRFTFIGHHLNQWKIGYYDPSILPKIDGLTGDTIQPPSVGFVEQLGRHLAVQAELVTKGVLQLRIGFDYQRRQELKLEQAPGLAGLSFGVGLSFRKFRLDYGFMVYSKAGMNNSIGLSTKLSDWKKH
ncbi:MAG: type IX secretion system protein PorQ [Flavobacteriales bacterium]